MKRMMMTMNKMMTMYNDVYVLNDYYDYHCHRHHHLHHIDDLMLIDYVMIFFDFALMLIVIDFVVVDFVYYDYVMIDYDFEDCYDFFGYHYMMNVLFVNDYDYDWNMNYVDRLTVFLVIQMMTMLILL